MKYVKQFMRIAIICMIGELLAYFLPLPIPASVYGMVLLFILLLTKVIKVEDVEEISTFFASIMPLFFISPSVKLMTAWGLLAENWLSILLMVVLSTIVTTAVTGLVSQWMMKHKKDKEQ